MVENQTKEEQKRDIKSRCQNTLLSFGLLKTLWIQKADLPKERGTGALLSSLWD